MLVKVSWSPWLNGRGVFWEKSIFECCHIERFSSYPRTRLWEVLVKSGIVCSCVEFLGCTTKKCGPVSPNGINTGKRYYLNNVTTARSMIWVNRSFHMKCSPFKGWNIILNRGSIYHLSPILWFKCWPCTDPQYRAEFHPTAKICWLEK